MQDKLRQFYSLVDSREIHPKIQESIKEFITNLNVDYSFFGRFLLGVEFFKSSKLPSKTCAVTINSLGACFLWDSDFIEKQPQSVVNFVVIHEVFHLLYNHVKRTRDLGANQKVSNIVQDMIINSTIKKHFVSNKEIEIETLKNKEGEDVVYYIPSEYKGEWVYEELYKWYMEENPPQEEGNEGSDENLEGGDKSLVDDHIDIETDMSDEVQKEFVDNMLQGMENMGHIGNNMEDLLDKLRNPKKNWFKLFRENLDRMKGTCLQRTYNRLNRRGIEGLKGKKLEEKVISVLLDVSGSMSGEWEKVLSEVNRKGITINLIPCDAQVIEENIKVIKTTKQLSNYEIVGLGGTDLNPAIDFVRTNKKFKTNEVIILTDGYAPPIDLKGFKKVLVLTVGTKLKISEGKATQVKI